MGIGAISGARPAEEEGEPSQAKPVGLGAMDDRVRGAE